MHKNRWYAERKKISSDFKYEHGFVQTNTIGPINALQIES